MSRKFDGSLLIQIGLQGAHQIDQDEKLIKNSYETEYFGTIGVIQYKGTSNYKYEIQQTLKGTWFQRKVFSFEVKKSMQLQI